MAHTAKHVRNARILQQRIRKAALPRTANGEVRTDKTDQDGKRITSYLRRYRDRYAAMPHNPTRGKK